MSAREERRHWRLPHSYRALFALDSKAELQSNDAGRPVDALLPRLLPLLRAPVPLARQLALSSINVFITGGTMVFVSMLPTFLSTLFDLTADESPQVRLLVCDALSRLVELYLDQLAPHMTGVIQFILHASNDTANEELALAASKFWIALAQRDESAQFFVPHIEQIIPVLLDHMVYSEMELASLLHGQRDDASVPDDPRDIKPQHARARRGDDGDDAGDGDYDDDDDDEDDDDADQSPAGSWTLRTVSSRALDKLAARAPDQVLQVIQPHLDALFNSPDW